MAKDQQVRWGLGDAVAGFVLALLVGVLLTPVVLAASGYSANTDQSDISLGTLALVQVPYSLTPMAVALWASYRKGRGPVTDFGLRLRLGDIPLGAVVGVATQYAAVVLYIPILWALNYSEDDLAGP